MPESVDYYEYKLQLAKEKHEMYKTTPKKKTAFF